jgi:phage terminase large subunit-like protein
MALAAGPKSKNLRPLPGPLPAPEWMELVTGELYPWQREVLSDLTQAARPRVAYIQVPRKNGKTRLAAVLALAEVCLGERRHVYAISDSERNLNSVLMRELRDIIGGSVLADSLHIFQNKIEVPETGSFIETRAANFKASQGINPHLVLFDEVHLSKEEIWSGMQMAGAAREDALLFGITTPGYDLTGLAHQLYLAHKAGDPTIYGRVFEGDSAADLDDRGEWQRANPCFDRPGFLTALEFDRERLPEHEFRRFRLGQWTATSEAWLPYGAWDACMAPAVPPPGPKTRVWLGFDGSFSGDSTALVAVSEDRHVWVEGCWENPGRKGWRVPRDDVERVIEVAMSRYRVVELLCDPPYWQREISEWMARWPNKVLEFPTGVRQRMAPATTAFYAAVMERQLTHDGDARLARHLGNAIVKPTAHGDVITKPDPDSPAKIDLAVAAVVAYSRAHVATAPRSPLVVL